MIFTPKEFAAIATGAEQLADKNQAGYRPRPIQALRELSEPSRLPPESRGKDRPGDRRTLDADRAGKMKPRFRILMEGDVPVWHLMQPAPHEHSFTTALGPVRGNPLCRMLRQGLEYWEALGDEDRARAFVRTAVNINYRKQP